MNKIKVKETSCYRCKKTIKIGEEVYRSVGKWSIPIALPNGAERPKPIYHYLCAECFHKLNDSEKKDWKSLKEMNLFFN